MDVVGLAHPAAHEVQHVVEAGAVDLDVAEQAVPGLAFEDDAVADALLEDDDQATGATVAAEVAVEAAVAESLAL